ncbi:MAG TPA: nitrilase-related carbon-nitrogen hydrolase [Verrucomicrobiae bacterium]|nr:nitrilase-related carbon-nitrogen hydrolase [Verrucomicrobiae bacterium]
MGLILVACFHAAYLPAQSGVGSLAIIGYVVCLVQLARLRTTRQCFYTGLATGFACVAPQLECFWRIFSAAAIGLWLVLALWIALFVALTHLAIVHLGLKRAAILVPFLWTGLEYFRSELYYLRFSWLNVGYAFAESSICPWNYLGVYGMGFVIAAGSSWLLVTSAKRVLTFTAITPGALFLIAFVVLPTAKIKRTAPDLRVAGVQLEFPDGDQIIRALDQIVTEDYNLVANHVGNRPVELVVLSEYTLDGEPPQSLRDWCKANGKFLIVGGKDTSPGTNYYNTAFVISTNGEIVFKQVKSVPIQFFKDGLPAPEQKLWESPWGKIGIAICYDLSYARVMDELVRQGAQMLIVPTMDVADWGRRQHELHARIAPVRAAEYGIPLFRVASSGISQGVDSFGRVQASAPFPGEGELIFFDAHLGAKGSLPMDRWVAPVSVVVTGAFALWLLIGARKRVHASPPTPVSAT